VDNQQLLSSHCPWSEIVPSALLTSNASIQQNQSDPPFNLAQFSLPVVVFSAPFPISRVGTIVRLCAPSIPQAESVAVKLGTNGTLQVHHRLEKQGESSEQQLQ
jgi:hypothetical protein